MEQDQLFYLGKIVKTYGTGTDLLVYLDVDEPSQYDGLDMVFIKVNEDYIPFFIEELNLRNNNTAVVSLEDIDDHEEADMYVNCELYLPVEALPPLTGNQFYYHEIKGFRVEDVKHGDVGIIDDVMEMPQQDLFRVLYNDKEILIPVHDDIIQEVDRENKRIKVETPEGLIDIYLEQ
ncbi:MAG: ribosome maturation factor RimM [Bacteroidales bacterium]|nr:ribosome maturation factor RimM [Bacteroidales bacterium]